MYAVQANGKALEFAHQSLRKDQSVVLTSVLANGDTLRGRPKTYELAERSLLMQCGREMLAQQYVAEELRADKDFVLAAVQQDIRSELSEDNKRGSGSFQWDADACKEFLRRSRNG